MAQNRAEHSRLSCTRAADEQADLVAAIIRQSFIEQERQLGVTPEAQPYFAGYETGERVRERMAKGFTVILGWVGDTPVGTISYRTDPEDSQHGFLARLAVLPGYRGHGYGEALLHYAEERLQESGVTRVELALVAHFDRLVRWYADLGYVARETKSYPHLPFEVLYMEKSGPDRA